MINTQINGLVILFHLLNLLFQLGLIRLLDVLLEFGIIKQVHTLYNSHDLNCIEKIYKLESMEDIDKRNDCDGVKHKSALEIVHGDLLDVFDWLPRFNVDVLNDEL